MHDSNFDSRMQLSDTDARLERFEKAGRGRANLPVWSVRDACRDGLCKGDGDAAIGVLTNPSSPAAASPGR